jgi:hypothetical protein
MTIQFRYRGTTSRPERAARCSENKRMIEILCHARKVPTVRLDDLSRPNDTADQPSRDPKYPMHGMPGMRKGADRTAGAEKNRQAPRTSRQRKTQRPAGHNVGHAVLRLRAFWAAAVIVHVTIWPGGDSNQAILRTLILPACFSASARSYCLESKPHVGLAAESFR